MRKFDCGLIGEELCVARDKSHHYIIKFSLKNGEWVIGNKRGRVRMKGGKIRVCMTMGYYEEPLELKMYLKESSLNFLINCVYQT